MARKIVRGQRVAPVKVEQARAFRAAMTEEEELLWHWLRANRLQGLHFRRQQVIAGFIVDFYCHAAALVVEVDGSIHNEQVEYDTERDQVLVGHGLRVLRISNHDIQRDLPSVLARIAAACRTSAPPAPDAAH
ncbi:MAG: DNA methylase, putative [Ktedonobacterales bacterium]|jgi:very-short-patch-repair endonuclease|nr:MAG: DNA methylase, putative [Ktedonobacterales bacterium]